MLTIQKIVEKVFEKWSSSVKPIVKNNYSMENSAIVNKLPYATLHFLGLPTGNVDLCGGEASVNATVQIDVYTSGQTALSDAYEIDNESHIAMTNMSFRRSYGPELIQSTDPSIKRLTSRYTRLIGYGDNL